MLRSTVLLFTLVVPACDPWAFDHGDEVPPWTPPPAKAVKPAAVPAEPAASAEPGALGGFVDCLLRCDRPGLTRAAWAECRYRCDGADGAPDSAASPTVDVDVVETVVHCMIRCPIRGGYDAACMDACEHLAADSPAAPSQAVLDELGACIGECRTHHPARATDRSTCERDCAAVARDAGSGRRSAL